MTNGVAILGVPIDSVRMEQALQRIEEFILERSFHQIATANVDFLVSAIANPEYREILRRCDLVVADGMPLILASRLLGSALLERVTGSDLVPRLAALSHRKGYGIFLLGAQREVSAAATRHLEEMGARIVGRLSPPVRPLDAIDDEEILDAIEKANPDILLVAFGSPKQEIWIDRNRPRLKVPVCVGIGGALDFVSGNIGRAPVWMQRACLEWCYRLWQEPRRLAPRYFKDALFLARYFSVQLAVSVAKPRGRQTLRIGVDSIGPVTILSASGMMTGSRLAELEHAALMVAEKSEALVVGLADVSYLGADGICTLARLHRVAKQRHDRFWLAGPRPALLRMLKASCWEELTQLVVPSVLEAVRQASPECLQPSFELAPDGGRTPNEPRIGAIRQQRSNADVAA
jgi:N-acetylglucosaminyldiphosphoundecaprenol N-acetyl-beta-D-mannosaminyltransferase